MSDSGSGFTLLGDPNPRPKNPVIRLSLHDAAEGVRDSDVHRGHGGTADADPVDCDGAGGIVVGATGVFRVELTVGKLGS